MFETIENAVKHLQAAQKEIADALDMAAIEALVVMIEVMLNQEDEEWATLSEEQRTAIVAMIDDAAFDGMTVELKRQVLQLLLVATMREDGLQAN
ncbi:MAG: class I SAM-dependent methyltransferase, partial [Weissella confusa]